VESYEVGTDAERCIEPGKDDLDSLGTFLGSDDQHVGRDAVAFHAVLAVLHCLVEAIAA
jgi:hypothetical protein